MEYKFRGQRTDGEGWAIGDLIQDPKSNQKHIREYKDVLVEYDTNQHEIVETEHDVIPESVELMDQWISVDDRLPEETDSVIVYDGEEVIDDCTFMPWGACTEFDWQVHAYGYDNDSFTVENVTHWQPLPSQPTLNEAPKD